MELCVLCGLYVAMRDTFNNANKSNIHGFNSAINAKFYVIYNTGHVRCSSPQKCCILRVISDNTGDLSFPVRACAYWGNPIFRSKRGQ